MNSFELEQLQRQSVLEEAKTWLGTPWRHMADKKGAGVDCAQFVRQVLLTVGIVDEIPDGKPYPSQWALHHDEERILSMVQRIAVEVQEPKPADIVLWQFGRCFSHCGFMLDRERVIHSFVKTGEVCIDVIRMGALSYMGLHKPRPVKFFDLWAKA